MPSGRTRLRQNGVFGTTLSFCDVNLFVRVFLIRSGDKVFVLVILCSCVPRNWMGEGEIETKNRGESVKNVCVMDV